MLQLILSSMYIYAQIFVSENLETSAHVENFEIFILFV